MNPDILALQGVHKSFRPEVFEPAQHVVKGVDLAIRAESFHALIGHNGAGKTTTLRIMLGLLRPDQGRVLFSGRPMQATDKVHLGYMPEINKLPATLTPREILHFHAQRFAPATHFAQATPTRSAQNRAEGHTQSRSRDGLSMGAIDAKRQEDALRQVGLWQHRNKRVAKLSKGMGRRLGWAQATLQSPEVLILDEPFSGLDPVGRADMADWMADYKQMGRTVVFCVHDLHIVERFADAVHVLNAGKVAFWSREPHPKEQDLLPHFRQNTADETQVQQKNAS